ncbi:MAG: AMP-binding protein [Polyangiaceae bacterium]|nr:AMP-binding protein [Polyangiaceae bacterium]
MDGLSLLHAACDPDVAARAALIAAGAESAEVFTYADLAALVAAACDRLARAGVHPGARVALAAPNSLGALVAIHALLALGAVLVPIHPRLTPIEATALIEDAAPALVLREPDLAALLPGGSASGAGSASISGSATASVAASVTASVTGATTGSARVPGSLPDPAGDLAIVFTSGTTGRPKGAVLPRASFIASAAASAAVLGVREHDRWLLCMPLCHVGGLSIVTRCLLARRAVVLVPRFDPAAVLASIHRGRATLLSVVPTMLDALLEADRDGALSSLRAVIVGGAAAPERLLEECARRGVPALTTYGLTEACSQVTLQPPRDPRAREPGAGRSIPGVELRIAPATGGDPAGRIQVRGPTLLRGYWRGPATPPEPATDPTGWLDTGDLGTIDDQGRLHVLARRADLIVTGGENVYPAEVERALEACPGVARALVFGVPDDRWGQLVAAAVVLAPAADLAALAAALTARLAPHKRPRRLCVVPELPVAPSGKLDRAGAFTRLGPHLEAFPP